MKLDRIMQTLLNLLLAVLLTLLVVSIVSCTVSATPMYSIKDSRLNATYCRQIIDSINDTYYQGMYIINFYNMSKAQQSPYDNLGFYFSGGVINIYVGCNYDILVHELAHHQQDIYGEMNFRYPHNEQFYRFESAIRNSSKLN